MLVDVDQLEVGDTVRVTLTWEVAGEMTVEAEVVDPSDTMGEE
jgi:copper(I)-binding protein